MPVVGVRITHPGVVDIMGAATAGHTVASATWVLPTLGGVPIVKKVNVATCTLRVE